MSPRFSALNGRIDGQGAGTIVLSHGFGTDQTAWAPIRDWLAPRFRVVSFDLAGCGAGGAEAYDPRRHDSLYGFADDLIEILDELGIEDCIYIGHSVSGMIGAAAAAVRPEPFRQLVMIGASPRYLNDGDYQGGFDQQDLDGLHAGMAANFQAWGAGFAPAVVGVPDRAAVDEFCRTLFLMRPDVALSISRTIFQSDMREVASRLESPTLLLQTRQDLAVPMAVAQWLQRHIDGAELAVVEAEGHLPHMTAPAAVIDILAARLAVLPG
ncbi:alpha/beta hydrolase [Pseudoroseomonas deserti]|uniref:Alpha/beta hydrolase n=1 Tax=Teichococcus deserti TaxID=1817963 RepID=A0A1V2H8A4_9PROT|nr:alpha/beta fold hydrolase [Pseudoroseomonas deserti]ONG56878.1 alpha/beta hydrolase [Pseudoroseomonas deserti]